MNISRIFLGVGDTGTSVALTGQSFNSANGSIGNQSDKELLGELSTLFSGTVKSDLSSAISGILGLVEPGGISYLVDENGDVLVDEFGEFLYSEIPTFTVIHDNRLTGEELAVLQGFVTTVGDITASLTGISISSALGQLNVDTNKGIISGLINSDTGSISVNADININGIEINVLTGNVGVDVGGDITRALSGLSFNSLAGNIEANINKSLTGLDLTLSQETLFATISKLANGQNITINQGDLSLSINKSLSGESVLTGQGTVLFQDSNVVVNLIGETITTSQGIISIPGLRSRQLTKIIVIGNEYKVLSINNKIKVLN